MHRHTHYSYGPSRPIWKFIRQENFLQYGKYPFAVMLISLQLRQHFPGFLWEYALFSIYMVAFAGFFLIRLMPRPWRKRPVRSVKGDNLSYVITIIIQLGLVAVSSGFKMLYNFEAWLIVLYGVGSFIDQILFLKKKAESIVVSTTADEPSSPAQVGK